MTLIKKFSYLPAAVLLVLAFISCDDDFTTIGGELVGGELDNLPSYQAGVVAYNKNIGPVQTNILPAHLLGVYNEPVYGQHIANVLTQLSLSSANPSFGEEPRLDSVIVTLPYYSTKLADDEQGNAVYRLDSVWGNSPYRLSIHRSNYFLNEFDPDANLQDRQRYYSDQGPLFENFLIGDPLYVNETFMPSSREVVYFGTNAETGETDTIAVSPRLRAHLPVQFFQENIINREGSPELFNNNAFKNFIRGLYFKAEPVAGTGNMMLLNFGHEDAGIVLHYTVFSETDDEENIGEPRSFRLDFKIRNDEFRNTIVNTFSQDMPEEIASEIADSNAPPGAENLFLRGGEGSMAIIELFKNEAELEEVRSKNWLVNDAHLTLYVNQDLVPGGQAEPDRLYLYNLDKNELLIDYRFDPTLEVPNPANAVVNHSRPLERGEDGKGKFYKIRITEHVRQILEGNAANVRLGLVVTQNIREVNNAMLKNQGEDGIRMVPTGAVITPKGTILHGNLSEEEPKRLRFTIFYTQTEN